MMIKQWNKENFGDIEAHISMLEEKQSRADEENWSDHAKLSIREELDNLYEARCSSLKQKSRLNWEKFGDRTKFFHGCVMRRRKLNHISGIFHEGRRVTNPNDVKTTFFYHFKEFFGTQGNQPLLRLDSLRVPLIDEDQSRLLEEDFSIQEIELALKEMDCGKSPGPDELNSSFLKANWDFLRNEVLGSFQNFYGGSPFPKGFNSSFIALGQLA